MGVKAGADGIALADVDAWETGVGGETGKGVDAGTLKFLAVSGGGETGAGADEGVAGPVGFLDEAEAFGAAVGEEDAKSGGTSHIQQGSLVGVSST